MILDLNKFKNLTITLKDRPDLVDIKMLICVCTLENPLCKITLKTVRPFPKLIRFAVSLPLPEKIDDESFTSCFGSITKALLRAEYKLHKNLLLISKSIRRKGLVAYTL